MDHGTFITADVLRVRGRGFGVEWTCACVSQELEAGVPTQRRVRAMRELCDIVATKRLEEVWYKGVVSGSARSTFPPSHCSMQCRLSGRQYETCCSPGKQQTCGMQYSGSHRPW